MSDWFDKAAEAVLALDDRELDAIGVPLMRPGTPEERVLMSLAHAETVRREAAAGRLGSADELRRLLGFLEAGTAHGYGGRIAALMRARAADVTNRN